MGSHLVKDRQSRLSYVLDYSFCSDHAAHSSKEDHVAAQPVCSMFERAVDYLGELSFWIPVSILLSSHFFILDFERLCNLICDRVMWWLSALSAIGEFFSMASGALIGFAAFGVIVDQIILGARRQRADFIAAILLLLMPLSYGRALASTSTRYLDIIIIMIALPINFGILLFALSSRSFLKQRFIVPLVGLWLFVTVSGLIFSTIS